MFFGAFVDIFFGKSCSPSAEKKMGGWYKSLRKEQLQFTSPISTHLLGYSCMERNSVMLSVTPAE